VGAYGRMFRRVAGNGDHSSVDSEINSGIDSYESLIPIPSTVELGFF
jgi:hypothetical protein